MPDYRVRWEIDVQADSPEQAAQIARDIQLNSESTANVFEIVSASGPGTHGQRGTVVDLDKG